MKKLILFSLIGLFLVGCGSQKGSDIINRLITMPPGEGHYTNFETKSNLGTPILSGKYTIKTLKVCSDPNFSLQVYQEDRQLLSVGGIMTVDFNVILDPGKYYNLRYLNNCMDTILVQMKITLQYE